MLRTAFAEMWKDPQFLADYSKVIKTEPILVTGQEGQEILARSARCRSPPRISWCSSPVA